MSILAVLRASMRTRSARDESVVCSVSSILAATTHDRHRVVVGRAGRGEVGLGARAGEVGEVGGRADADGLGAALVEPGEVVGLRRQQGALSKERTSGAAANRPPRKRVDQSVAWFCASAGPTVHRQRALRLGRTLEEHVRSDREDEDRLAAEDL